MDTRKLIEQGLRLGRGAVAQGWGLAQKARNARSGPKDLDDVTLTRKVESEVFRERDAAKSKVNVNVVDGVVELRGEVRRPAYVRAIEARVRAIPEVKDVENLLHLPKTPSPTRADTPARQRKSPTRERKATAARQRRTTTVTDDQTDRVASAAEPAPEELAREGKGRQPAPLGSQGEGATQTNGESTADPSVSPTGTS